MWKQLLSDNRLFTAAVCLLVFIAGGLLYLQTVKQEAKRDVQRTQEIVEQRQTPQPQTQPAETGGGHYHADGTYHAEPHQTPAPTEGVATSEGGHWSDAYLPPIEELEVTYADDTDAMFIIDRVKILLKHERDGLGHNPAADKAFAELMNFTNEIISSRGTERSQQRSNELLKFRWYILPNPSSSLIFENEGGIGK